MTGLFALLFLAALVGVFKPYIGDLGRKHFGIAAVVAFIGVGVTAPKADVDPETVAEPEGSAADVKTAQSESDAETVTEPKSLWRYNEQVDAMRDETSYFAELDGTNTIDLGFPYGTQRGKILIRQSPKFGFDILVGVDSGRSFAAATRGVS